MNARIQASCSSNSGSVSKSHAMARPCLCDYTVIQFGWTGRRGLLGREAELLDVRGEVSPDRSRFDAVLLGCVLVHAVLALRVVGDERTHARRALVRHRQPERLVDVADD